MENPKEAIPIENFLRTSSRRPNPLKTVEKSETTVNKSFQNPNGRHNILRKGGRTMRIYCMSFLPSTNSKHSMLPTKHSTVERTQCIPNIKHMPNIF